MAEDLFASWGYFPAELPFVDYFDNYRSLMDDRTLAAVYRLIDRDGDLLMLRSDITLFLARNIGSSIASEALPLRVSYTGAIFRHQESEDISHNEFFQLGAELIGVPDLRADIEVATILGELVSLLELPKPVLHIGSRALFNAATAGLAPSTYAVAADLVRDRAWKELEEIVPSGAVFRFIGTTSEFGELGTEAIGRIEPDQSEQAAAALDDLLEFATTLERVGVPFDVRIDLSEIGTQAYYTGCVFTMYLEGVATAVASGGRYDDLLGHFGANHPSVGFSLMLRKIADRIGSRNRFSPPVPSKVDSGSIEADIAEARKRRGGGPVTL